MTAFFTATFGRKNYLTASIILFVDRVVPLRHVAQRWASWCCGACVQGAGGAALLSTAQATLRQIFPREEQGLVQAIFLLGIIVAPTLGPTLGGWITDNYNWNWCFFINVPIGIVSTFLVTHVPARSAGHADKPQAIDWLGIALLIDRTRLAAVRARGRATRRTGSTTR